MYESDSERREQELWIDRGEVLGRWLKTLLESRFVLRVWKAPSNGISRLVHWIEQSARRQRSTH